MAVDNKEHFKNFIAVLKVKNFIDFDSPLDINKFNIYIDAFELEFQNNLEDKTIDNSKYISNLKKSIVSLINSRNKYYDKIKDWEQKYNFTYPDFPLVETKVKDKSEDDFDFEENKTVLTLKDKDKLTPEEQQDIEKMQNDFSEYIKEDAINKVLKIIEEEENNNIPVDKWKVDTFALFLFFLKKAGFETSITRNQLKKTLMSKYDYSLGLDALYNTITYINGGKKKDPLTIINIIKVMPHLVEYPLSLIKASEMLIELCRKQKTPS
jgi:hypothetical protein